MHIITKDLIKKYLSLYEFFNKDERLAGRRLISFLKGRGEREVAVGICLEFIYSLKLAASRKEVAFLCLMLEALGENAAEVELIRKAALRELKTIKVEKRKMRLATKENFRKTILKLAEKEKFEEIMFLVVALATGRRGIDVVRVNKENLLEVQPGKFLAKLDFDKRSVKPVFFTISVEEVKDWLEGLISLDRFNGWLRQRCGEVGFLFRKNLQKNIGRFLQDFTLHSLRTIKAVWLLLDGCSEDEVKRRLGWVDDRMLIRYVRSDPGVLRDCRNLEEALFILDGFLE